MAINPSIGQKLIRSVSDDADFSVSLQSPEEKDQEIAQQLWEEKRMKSLQDKSQVSKWKKHLCSVRIHSWKESSAAEAKVSNSA